MSPNPLERHTVAKCFLGSGQPGGWVPPTISSPPKRSAFILKLDQAIEEAHQKAPWTIQDIGGFNSAAQKMLAKTWLIERITQHGPSTETTWKPSTLTRDTLSLFFLHPMNGSVIVKEAKLIDTNAKYLINWRTTVTSGASNLTPQKVTSNLTSKDLGKLNKQAELRLEKDWSFSWDLKLERTSKNGATWQTSILCRQSVGVLLRHPKTVSYITIGSIKYCRRNKEEAYTVSWKYNLGLEAEETKSESNQSKRQLDEQQSGTGKRRRVK